MSHPRDPRLRRQARDPLAAAVALELAADSMRAHLTTPEPEPDLEPVTYSPEVVDHLERWDTAAELSVDTSEPEYDDARRVEDDDHDHDHAPLMNGRCAICGEQLEVEQYDPDPVPAIEPYTDEPEPVVGPFAAGGQAPEPPALAVLPPVPVFSSEHPPTTWRSEHDPRSLAFGASRLLRGSGPLQEVRLPTGPVLDQLAAGATLEEQSCCTGCGTAAALNVHRLAPAYTPGRPGMLGLEDAERVYDRARQVDEYLGDHTAGSSVLGAMKAAVDLGMIGGYLWCFGTRDIAQTLIQRRLPVVIGVRWSSGMWQTGPGGLVRLDGDRNAMGHCLAIVGLTLKGPQGQPGPYFVWQNSAGESYGAGGFGYVHHRDLSALLRGVGEAAVPMLDPQAAA